MNDEKNDQPEIAHLEIEVAPTPLAEDELALSGSTELPAEETPSAPAPDEEPAGQVASEAADVSSAADPHEAASPIRDEEDWASAESSNQELAITELDDLVDEIVEEFLGDEFGSAPEDDLLTSVDQPGTDEAVEVNGVVEVDVVDEGSTDESITATREEIKPVIECLLFVAEEPLPFKVICKVLGTVPEEDVQLALDNLVAEYDARDCGLEIREVAGGWRISTRPQHHDFIRKYLKTRPSARLSLPALETLAVIAYKQPITVPEILEIRGVSSSSAIKTLLEKRLIVTRGRKETVGRPMMYGTSRDFLIQFGLKDLTELPSIEDFEDLAQ
ncbi:MAG: SMC-Scp complex subunit ScpB [Acidobacteriota bacterium]